MTNDAKVINSHTLFFKNKKHELDDIYTFEFEKKEQFYWLPGQYGVFFFDNIELSERPSRSFSIASIPEDRTIKIGMRIAENHSEYKEALLNLKEGDTMTMKGPMGHFYVSEPAKPHIFMAGGIGITPFRAIFADISEKNKVMGNVKLLYIQRDGIYAYKDELEQFAREKGFIKIIYLRDTEEFDKLLQNYIAEHANDAQYFVSGVPSMIQDVKQKLEIQGVEKQNIKYDSFTGY